MSNKFCKFLYSGLTYKDRQHNIAHDKRTNIVVIKSSRIQNFFKLITAKISLTLYNA